MRAASFSHISCGKPWPRKSSKPSHRALPTGTADTAASSSSVTARGMGRIWRLSEAPMTIRFLAILVMAGVVSAAPQSTPPARTVVDQYCVGCHNDKANVGGLALNNIDVTRAGDHPEVWEKVIRKLRGRMMPPPGRPRPDERGYDAVVSYLETSLDRAAAANLDPGRTETFRRLNRTEYQNAIRDLLALDVDV